MGREKMTHINKELGSPSSFPLVMDQPWDLAWTKDGLSTALIIRHCGQSISKQSNISM